MLLNGMYENFPSVSSKLAYVNISNYMLICSTLPAEPTVHKARLKDFDLNSTYGDTQECGEAYEQSVNPAYIVNGSPTGPSWLLQDSRQLSPPQTSGTSYSTSEKSQSSSNGDGQVC